MQTYRKRNRSDQAVNPEKMPAAMNESELVLKLKKDELFDQYVLLPHSELNSIVFDSVDSFVEKYKGTDMTLTIFTGPLSTLMQDVFRETYRSHYEDEYQKVQPYLMSFFTYGYFGIIYQWIKYGFDETPEEIKKRIDGAIRSAVSSGKSE